jgi:UMF1 family MFS transporter
MSTVEASPPAVRPPLFERLALHRPELRAWAMYDWANSAMYTVIITAVFPVFFARVAAAGMPQSEVRGTFGLATTVCMTLAAVLGPILGAVADYARLKKKLFAVFVLLGVLATGAMFFIHRGDWMLAAILFGIANISIASSLVFYDAMLPHVARAGETDRLSTSGYAVGYLGGGLCLALCVALIAWGRNLGIHVEPPDDPAGSDWLTARIGFLIVAVWWLVFTLPYLFRVSEPPLAIEPDERPGQNPIRVAFTRIGETLRALKTYRNAFLFMLAFLAYSDGIGTIIRMATLYAAELQIPDAATVGCVLLVQFIGIPFAVGFGKLAGRIGPKRAIWIALSGYVFICLWASQISSTWEFVAMAVMVGMVQGGAQALSRSLFASLIPKHKSAEFFGLFSTLEKFAGIAGPYVFSISASSRSAVLWIIVFFVVGAGVLAFVDVAAGRTAAQRADDDLTTMSQATPDSNSPPHAPCA